MKNSPSILFGGITIASALLCVGAAALWVHDRSNPNRYNDEIGFSTARSHYTISSRDGHLRLSGPPKATAADLSEEAWDALRKLNNLDIDWATGEPRKGTPAAKLEELGSPVLPLLRGLDSPRKFGAAAVLLERAGNLVTWLHPPNGLVGSAEDFISAYGVVLDGNRPKDDPDSFPFVVMPGYPPDFRCRVDQHMHSSKRSELHERYDRTIFSVPHGWLALAFAILPARFLFLKLRSRRRFGPGRCAQCGYDLRATLERCPECGRCPTDKTKE